MTKNLKSQSLTTSLRYDSPRFMHNEVKCSGRNASNVMEGV